MTNNRDNTTPAQQTTPNAIVLAMRTILGTAHDLTQSIDADLNAGTFPNAWVQNRALDVYRKAESIIGDAQACLGSAREMNELLGGAPLRPHPQPQGGVRRRPTNATYAAAFDVLRRLMAASRTTCDALADADGREANSDEALNAHYAMEDTLEVMTEALATLKDII